MAAQENVEIVRRFFEELWNRRMLDLADTLIDFECLTHQLRSGMPIDATSRGPAAIKSHVSEWLSAFPDLRFTIEQTVAQDDRVVSQLIMNGTHTGNWLGISPTGKTVSIRMMTIHRVRDGKIIEDWVLVESMGFFQQLGIILSTPDLIANFVKEHSAAD